MSRMRSIFKGGENGFTLIELLVVIAVLGILAAIAIPRLGGVTDKARMAEAQQVLGSLKTAFEMEFVETDGYPTDGSEFDTLASSYLDRYSATDPSTAPVITNGVGTWKDWQVAWDNNGDSDDTTFNVTLGQDLDSSNSLEASEQVTLSYDGNDYTTN